MIALSCAKVTWETREHQESGREDHSPYSPIPLLLLKELLKSSYTWAQDIFHKIKSPLWCAVAWPGEDKALKYKYRNLIRIRVERTWQRPLLWGIKGATKTSILTPGLLFSLPKGNPFQLRGSTRQEDPKKWDINLNNNWSVCLQGEWWLLYFFLGFFVWLPWRSVFVEELGSNCCRQMPVFF